MLYVLALVAVIAIFTWAYVAFRHYGVSQKVLRKQQAAERSRHFSEMAAIRSGTQIVRRSPDKGFGRR